MRDVAVVVLDEATARMDPVTEALVVRAADRLLTGRTGILVAHRLSTTARADLVAVLDHGRVVQQGPRSEVAAAAGPFRRLLEASGDGALVVPATGRPSAGDGDALRDRRPGSSARPAHRPAAGGPRPR